MLNPSAEECSLSTFPQLDSTSSWSVCALGAELQGRLAAAEAETIAHANKEYEGFGSFHSENVEDIMNMDSEEYRPPPLPSFAHRILSLSELQEMESAGEDEATKGIILARSVGPCCFGKTFRQQHFTITPEFVFINHGAFGGALRGALEIKHRFEIMMEGQIVHHVDRVLLPLILYSVRRIAEFVNANPKQIVLGANATFMLNSAMNLIQREDVVAYFDTEYLSVYKMLYFRCTEVGASLHEIPLQKHFRNPDIMGNDEALTNVICESLPEGCTAVVLDHITSTAALCFPVFTCLVPMLRRKGVTKIIIDGAHAPFQVELDFNALSEEAQPSLFIGNLHKWFSLPKSAGFMWVHGTLINSVFPAVRSHGAGEGLLSEFIWDGTRDHSSYLCIPAVIDFWRSQGLERVRMYCTALLEHAAVMLCSRFGTNRVSRHSPFMTLVELPEDLQAQCITPRYLQDVLHDVYRVEAPVKKVENRLYIRISAFVYNEPADYVYLCEAVLSIARKFKGFIGREKP
uniref:Uncharacterized protein TCIL3000_11_7920 n=1 Tax=Trypanosoma congolense (strain IL3000) TaxID=1068625 RepID=G0V124_TRYCI|nr:unnamed protein product [Trypanosoma congolense IL3000]